MSSSITRLPPLIFLLITLTTTTAHAAAEPDPENSNLVCRDIGPPFFTTITISALSVGSFIFFVTITLLCLCCRRKRQNGRKILAAYESPDRKPYETIYIKKGQTMRKRPNPETPSSISVSTLASTITDGGDVKGVEFRISRVEVHDPPHCAQSLQEPERAALRKELDGGGYGPPQSPFSQRPMAQSPTLSISPYGPPSPRFATNPSVRRGGGVAIGGAV